MRLIRVVVQRLPQLANHAVQSDVEVNKGIRRPQLLLQLFAGHYPSSVCHQLGQHPEGLFLQFDPYPVLAQFPYTLGELEWSEAENAVALG